MLILQTTMTRLIQIIYLLVTLSIVYGLPRLWDNDNGQFPIFAPPGSLSNPKTDDPAKVNVTLNVMSRCSDSVSFSRPTFDDEASSLWIYRGYVRAYLRM